jgi:hypothetical protein
VVSELGEGVYEMRLEEAEAIMAAARAATASGGRGRRLQVAVQAATPARSFGGLAALFGRACGANRRGE